MYQVFAETITLSQEAQEDSKERSVYAESELFDLMSPSTVRILQHVEGTVTIPSFVIDPKKQTIAVDITKEPTVLENISENLLGSGFFVSSDGYIITNAHTVSLTARKLVIIDSFIQHAIFEATEGENVEEVIDELFTKEIVDFMLQETSFDLQTSIIVLCSEEDAEEKEAVFNIYDLGFVAEVLFVNDVFYKEGQDVALLKIIGEGYPSASLSKKESIGLGEKVYLFQAQAAVGSVHSLAREDIDDMSLISGVVVRENMIASSSVYELDLNVSIDLGGSPVFDVAGNILGVASYDASSGFKNLVSMFFITNDSISTVLSLASTTASESVFHARVKEGLLFEKELKCEEAQTSFAVALGSKNVFVDKSVFDGRIASCDEKLIAYQEQNENLSGILHTFQQKIASMNIFHWVIVVACFILFSFFVLWIVSRKGRQEITEDVDEKPIRSETVKTARRAPLSERMPVLHDKNKLMETEIIPPQKEKLSDGIKKKDIEIEKEVKKTDKNDILQQKEKSGDLHVVTTKFPRRVNLSENISDIPQKTRGVLNISEDDKERLASLWPNKYSKKDKKEKEPLLYPVVFSYIKNTRDLGFKDDDIKKELLRVGWKQEDIDNAFKATI